MSEFDDLRKKLQEGNKKGGEHPFHPSAQYRPANSQQEKQYQPKQAETDGDVDWEHILKRVSLFMGVFVAIISVYFSYDGFDNSISGGNPNYTWWAKLIGITLGVAVTILQFVFSSSYEKLNASLKFFGLASYAYSMWSNYQGITHILQMEQNMAIVATLFMDGVPEPLIAWALGASMRGDFVGNILKSVGGLLRTIFIKQKPQARKYQSTEEYFSRLRK